MSYLILQQFQDTEILGPYFSMKRLRVQKVNFPKFTGPSARIQIQTGRAPKLFISFLSSTSSYSPQGLPHFIHICTQMRMRWLHKSPLSGASFHYSPKPVVVFPTEMIQWALFFTGIIFTLLGNWLPTPTLSSSLLLFVWEAIQWLVLSLKSQLQKVD